MSRPEQGFYSKFDKTEAAAGYLQLIAETFTYQSALLDILDPQAGEIIVDIGCGPAHTLGRIAQNPGVRTIGVDVSHELLVQARAGTSSMFVQSDAEQLGLRSGFASAVIAERALQWIKNPLVAMREMRRILKDSGRVVIAEVDWPNVKVDHPDQDATRRIVVPEHISMPHPRIAARLPELFRSAGFRPEQQVVIMDVFSAPVGRRLLRLDAIADNALEIGAIEPEEKQPWLERFDAPGEKFAIHVPVVIAEAICR